MQSSVYGLYLNCVLIMWVMQMLFYIYIIRPHVYFNARAYIARRRLLMERKARDAELGNNQDATVDFPNNQSQNSLDKDLIAGASDQGQSYGMSSNDPAQLYQYLVDSPPPQPENETNLESSFIDENDHDIGYTKYPRSFGDGELRIGTYLSLNEDIYSLGFACLLKNEIVDEALLKEEAARP